MEETCPSREDEKRRKLNFHVFLSNFEGDENCLNCEKKSRKIDRVFSVFMFEKSANWIKLRLICDAELKSSFDGRMWHETHKRTPRNQSIILSKHAEVLEHESMQTSRTNSKHLWRQTSNNKEKISSVNRKKTYKRRWKEISENPREIFFQSRLWCKKGRKI